MTPLSTPKTGYHQHGGGGVSREGDNVITTSNPRTHAAMRPASYIRVVDLAKSYNINVEKMKAEIERLENAKNGESEVSAGETVSLVEGGKEDSHSLISKVTDDSASSGEKKLREFVASKGYPKRFSAMNGGFNLCLLVGKVDIVVDKLRVDKSRVRLAEVQVGDETGTISLRARDEQIDALQKVSEEGGAIVLRNSSIELFQGKYLRLAVTKWGKISVYPDHVTSTPKPPTSMNVDMDLSIVDLTRVPSDLWLESISNSPTSMHSKATAQHVDQHQKQHHRSKGRGHDRRDITQQPYNVHRIPSRHDYGYNQMMGMTQGMPAPANSFAYPGTQYYSGYDDASFHPLQYQQRIEQQKQQQQLLSLQHQHYQIQRQLVEQMEQMEQMNYHLMNYQSTPHRNQASCDYVGEIHNSDASTRNQTSAEQVDEHQAHVDTKETSDNRSITWSVTGNNNMMTVEAPMSPQMNPHAASFAPHYATIPDLGAGLTQGQQPYYMQSQQQGHNNSNYNPTSAYYEELPNAPHTSNEQQQQRKHV